jgi:DNA polymerase (family 10)
MSSEGTRLPLATARRLAERIAAELAPLCQRVAIAGSIRRGRPEVGDIDLVILPITGGTGIVAVHQRILRTGPRVLKSGPQYLVVLLEGGVQLDVWFASPGEEADLFGGGRTRSNFGTLLLCRTGSVAHNIWLVEMAKARGLRWNPHWGVFNAQDEPIASETEEQIFAALGLPFTPPELRER